MNKLWVVLLAVLAMGTFADNASAEVTKIDNEGLHQAMAEGVAVIDIRTPAEWQNTGVIEGSHRLMFFDANRNHDAQAWMSKLAEIVKPGEPVALICHSGGRSRSVSQYLDEQGTYTRIYDVAGGIAGWLREGKPTVSVAP